MFLKVEDAKFGGEIIINTDSISVVFMGAQTLVMNGVHGEGDGLIRLTKQGLDLVLKNINATE